MGKARLLILFVAIAAGGAAFFMISNTNSTPQEVVAQVMPQSEGPRMVRVLVAAEDFGQGAIMDTAKTRWVKWPEAAVPEFYITEDETQFVEDLPLMRARIGIFANEPIYERNTVRHGDRGMMAAIMTPGMRAVTVRLDTEELTGGFILPGDRVDIFTSGVNASENSNETKTTVLFSNVRVLAIDQIYAKDIETSSIVGRTVTLEVMPSQVKPFIDARTNQAMTLVLRSVFDDGLDENMIPTEPEQVVIVRYGAG